MAKKEEQKAWQVVKDKELEQVSRKASAAKQGKPQSKEKTFTLTRIGIEPHKYLRKIATLEEIQMQELLDRLVSEYKEKKYPNL